jgi:hypothetical protein
MREGFYKLEFIGAVGWGVGVVVLDTGFVAGADAGGVIYCGTYTHDSGPDELVLDIELRVPPGAQLVTGGQAHPLPRKLRARSRIPRTFSGTQVFNATTDDGPVNYRLTKIMGSGFP